MLPSRAIYRSPSHGRALAKNSEDAEAAFDARLDARLDARPGSPKKAEPAAFRRRRPLVLMSFILLVAFILGAGLFFNHKASNYNQDSKAVAAAAGASGAATTLGPSIAPQQQTWNLMDLALKTKSSYDDNTPPGSAYVEFTAPGLFLPLRDALNLNLPLQEEELRLLESPTTQNYNNQQRGRSGGGGKIKEASSQINNSLRDTFNSLWTTDPLLDNNTNLEPFEKEEGGIPGRHLGQIEQQQQQHSTLHAAFSNGADIQEEWPQPEGIRLLVAVTSACCTQVSLQRRAAIRRTWAALIRQRYRSTDSGRISITFFLSQPENETTRTEWLPALEEEVVAHNDTVLLRGKDFYTNLPNKSFRMLRYALAHPAEYTHVLKADDDTWVRMHKVLEYLYEKESGGVSNEASMSSSAAAIATVIQRKAELERMSRERGAPIVSEGMTLYDATSIVQRVDQDPNFAKESVDDIDGSKLTLEELAQRSNWYANRARNAIFEEALLRNKQHYYQQEQQEEENNTTTTTTTTTTTSATSSASNSGEKQGKRRALQQEQQQFTTHQFTAQRPRLSGVYLGCIENQRGFQPIRDKTNKWYVSEDDLPNDGYPHNVKYLAGWGYILSRDLVMHIVQKVNTYERTPEVAPMWFTRITFEDVLVGLLLHDVVPVPESHSGFRPAWRSCVPDTAVRHLDIDSPRLLKGLVEQDISGIADIKPVQCSTGQFLPGDYAGWHAWKSSLV